MFASQDDSAASRGERSKVPFCSRNRLFGAAFLDAKEKDPSGPVKILNKGENQFSPKYVNTPSMQETINPASWQAFKGHDVFFILEIIFFFFFLQ